MCKALHLLLYSLFEMQTALDSNHIKNGCNANRFSGTYLNALYTGLYQQTKEQGMNSRSQTMASPKSIPPLTSTKKRARKEMKLKTRVQTEPLWRTNKTKYKNVEQDKKSHSKANLWIQKL